MSKKYRMGKRFQKVLTMGILAEIAVWWSPTLSMTGCLANGSPV